MVCLLCIFAKSILKIQEKIYSTAKNLETNSLRNSSGCLPRKIFKPSYLMSVVSRWGSVLVWIVFSALKFLAPTKIVLPSLSWAVNPLLPAILMMYFTPGYFCDGGKLTIPFKERSSLVTYKISTDHCQRWVKPKLDYIYLLFLYSVEGSNSVLCKMCQKEGNRALHWDLFQRD